MTKKIKNSKKVEKLLEEISVFLKKHQISGILHLPNDKVVSIYKGDGERLQVLDYAKLEMEYDVTLRKYTAKTLVLDEMQKLQLLEKYDYGNKIKQKKKTNNKHMEYVG